MLHSFHRPPIFRGRGLDVLPTASALVPPRIAMIIPHRLCSFLVNFIPKNFILICCYCQWGLLIGGYLYI